MNAISTFPKKADEMRALARQAAQTRMVRRVEGDDKLFQFVLERIRNAAKTGLTALDLDIALPETVRSMLLSEEFRLGRGPSGSVQIIWS